MCVYIYIYIYIFHIHTILTHVYNSFAMYSAVFQSELEAEPGVGDLMSKLDQEGRVPSKEGGGEEDEGR